MKRILKKVGIVFLALIVISAIGNVLGSGKSKPKESAKTESKTESKVESTAATTETAVTQTAAAPSKAQRNGFDEASNQIYEYEGFAFSLPTYLTPAKQENGNVAFSFNGEASDTVSLSVGKNSVSFSAQDFENGKTEMINSVAENAQVTWQSTSPITIAGCPGMVGMVSSPTDSGQTEFQSYFWYDVNNQAVLLLFYIETGKTTYTYTDDLKKIMASVTYTGNGLTGQQTTPEPDANENAGAETSDVPAGVSPEFKAQMDEYEAFFDEYVEFMKTYAESDNPVALMSEYLDFLQKYTKYMQALDAIDEKDLSDAEALYFAEVTLRIDQKLLDVTASMY